MAFVSCVAIAAERQRPLPADGMVPDPLFTSTHTITIDASPEHVWPWIAQMGAGRAGWHSWDVIDNAGDAKCAVLFQVLTFAQPPPVVGLMWLGALMVPLVPRKRPRSDRVAMA